MTAIQPPPPPLSMRALPPALTPYYRKLEAALQTAQLSNWAEGTKFVEAVEVQGLAEILIETIHPHLEGIRIAYLFEEHLTLRGAPALGTATKVGAKLAFFTELAFIIEINWTAWRELNGVQKLALLDHELCHCDKDEELGTPVLLHHDVEEFTSIIGRWGIWRPDLRPFAKAITQLELHFEDGQ